MPAQDIYRHTFNTGRLYTQEGQIIRCVIAADDYLYFNDVSRMIVGRFKSSREVHASMLSRQGLESTQALMEVAVMLNYDGNDYEPIIHSEFDKAWKESTPSFATEG